MVTLTLSQVGSHCGDARITDVTSVTSYSWVKRSDPSIMVPGVPPLWVPLPRRTRVQTDCPASRLLPDRVLEFEASVRASTMKKPVFNLDSVDLITDQDAICKLLALVSVKTAEARRAMPSLKFHVDIKNQKIMLCMVSTAASLDEPSYRIFDRSFPRANTELEIDGCLDYHRVISYKFCGLSMMLSHEVDAYVNDELSRTVAHEREQGQDWRNMDSAMTVPLEKLSEQLSLNHGPQKAKELTLMTKAEELTFMTTKSSTVRFACGGHTVPFSSTIKTEARHSVHENSVRYELREHAPQLWASQTARLAEGKHPGNRFREPSVDIVTDQIVAWETESQDCLQKLGWLLQEIVTVAQSIGEKVTMKYDPAQDGLTFSQKGAKDLLPSDLYQLWDKEEKGMVHS